MAEEGDYSNQYMNDSTMKVRDLEEKQRIMKDRVLLIGENLVEMREETQEKILEMKKDLEDLKQKVTRITSFIETISGEFSKFAKKEDLEILAKQAKMFQPLIKGERLKNK